MNLSELHHAVRGQLAGAGKSRDKRQLSVAEGAALRAWQRRIDKKSTRSLVSMADETEADWMAAPTLRLAE